MPAPTCSSAHGGSTSSVYYPNVVLCTRIYRWISLKKIKTNNKVWRKKRESARAVEERKKRQQKTVHRLLGAQRFIRSQIFNPPRMQSAESGAIYIFSYSRSRARAKRRGAPIRLARALEISSPVVVHLIGARDESRSSVVNVQFHFMH